MPTYEYACSSCGNAWEEMQKITAAPIEVCPACNKPTAKRQISGGNFILKGGGWYADLYSSSKPKADKAGADKGGGETKSESKSEAKSEGKKDGGASGSGSSGSSGSGSSGGGGSSGGSGSTGGGGSSSAAAE